MFEESKIVIDLTDRPATKGSKKPSARTKSKRRKVDYMSCQPILLKVFAFLDGPTLFHKIAVLNRAWRNAIPKWKHHLTQDKSLGLNKFQRYLFYYYGLGWIDAVRIKLSEQMGGQIALKQQSFIMFLQAYFPQTKIEFVCQSDLLTIEDLRFLLSDNWETLRSVENFRESPKLAQICPAANLKGKFSGYDFSQMEDENYIPVESDEEEEIILPFTDITFDDCFDDYGEPKHLSVWGARRMHYIESPDIFDMTKFEQAFELEDLTVTQTDIDIEEFIEKLEKIPKIKRVSINLKPQYCQDLQFITQFLKFMDKSALKQVFVSIKVHHTMQQMIQQAKNLQNAVEQVIILQKAGINNEHYRLSHSAFESQSEQVKSTITCSYKHKKYPQKRLEVHLGHFEFPELSKSNPTQGRFSGASEEQSESEYGSESDSDQKAGSGSDSESSSE